MANPLPRSPVVALVEPNEAVTQALTSYNRRLPPSQQQATGGVTIPQAFIDAMTVREEVYVKEQQVPLENEFDEDDPRSVHWVTYASPQSQCDEKIPTGTIRLVPFPHPPHPRNGGNYVDGKLMNAEDLDGAAQGGAAYSLQQNHHNDHGSYVKLGRLAVIPSRRGKGEARVLAQEALRWLKKSPSYFNQPTMPPWNGLVCAHAQEDAVKFWSKSGFVTDGKMGRWFEEGIPHVGMWLEIKVEMQH